IPSRNASRAAGWTPESHDKPEGQSVVPQAQSETGGFRGLARRTRVATADKRTVRATRLEPETRTPADLALDTLDAQVAESRARLLEREALRHGVDLSEVSL